MRRLKDAAVWLCIFLSCALLACALAFPALAQELGTGLICDTAEQAEAFVAVAEIEDTDTALQQVNAEHNVCVIAQVAFLRGAEAKTLTVNRGIIRITEIVVAAIMDRGRFVPIPPAVQFTLFLEKAEGA